MSDETTSTADTATPLPTTPSRRGIVALRTALVASVTLALAAALFAIGYQLAIYDERSHVPGHWIYRTLVVAPSLVQLAYLLPIHRAARRRADRTVANGVVAGGVLALLLNVAVVALVAWATSYD
jgi:hypothetical protein